MYSNKAEAISEELQQYSTGPSVPAEMAGIQLFTHTIRVFNASGV